MLNHVINHCTVSKIACLKALTSIIHIEKIHYTKDTNTLVKSALMLQIYPPCFLQLQMNTPFSPIHLIYTHTSDQTIRITQRNCNMGKLLE